MPVSRRTSEGLAGDLANTYGAVEVRLLRMIADSLAAGNAEAPGWAEAKLAELQLFRRRATKVMAETTATAVGQVGDAATTAYLRGAAAGEGELVNLGRRVEAPPAQAERAVEALVRAQAGQLEDMGPRVVRQTADAYRDAVVAASAGTLSGGATRRQDAQQVLDDLARRGVSGFTDSSGRQWGLESYVDMATRTTTAQAAVAGHMDRLEQGGLSLFLVSTSSRECERCAPWEGKVLSRGPVEALQPNVLTGEVERVRVDGTVNEAMRDGLFHPNCTHNLTGYVHGATRRDEASHDPELYAEKQRQRAMERHVREWKRREAAALDDVARRKASGKVRGWQKALREHTTATGLPRKRHRESFDVTPAAPVSDRGADHVLDLRYLDAEVVEGELQELMTRNDYGGRFEQLAAELDRRDNANQDAIVLGRTPDPMGEQEALERLLNGGLTKAQVLARQREREAEVARRPKRDPEKELRESYETWVHTQWLRAEEECRGHLLSREGEALFRRGELDVLDLFTRKRRDLRYASPELQEWFAQPGNQRLSYPEFRAGMTDDKAAREATQRLRSRGYESEYG